jgi:hypothetical protein
MRQVVLILAVILFVKSGKAENVLAEDQLTLAERQQIAWAIHILLKYEALGSDENKCLQFKPSLIDRLRKEGLLEKGNSAMMSICIGSTN